MKASTIVRGLSVGLLAAAIVGGGLLLAKSGGGQTADPQGADNEQTAQPLAKNDDGTTESPAAATESPAAATQSPAAATQSPAAATESPAATQDAETVTFEVRRGEDADTVSQELEEAGVIEDAEKFNTYLKQTGASDRLIAGTYTLTVGASYPELVKALAAPSK